MDKMKTMKAKELIKILSEDPERDVMIALGSFRVAAVVSVKQSTYIEDMQNPAVPSFDLFPGELQVRGDPKEPRDEKGNLIDGWFRLTVGRLSRIM